MVRIHAPVRTDEPSSLGVRAEAQSARDPHALDRARPELIVSDPDLMDRTSGRPQRPLDPPAAAKADASAQPSISSRSQRLRVLLVDDHKIVREGLAGLLELEKDIEVVGQAADGEMAIQLARELQPDVVSMDITMPRMNGIEATRQIKAEFPNMRIVGLSMHESSDMARAMQQAGAADYVSKDAPSEELLRAIRGGDGSG